jgi:hypothetical protein
MGGREERDGGCEWPGCAEAGTFRAPKSNRLPGDQAGWQFFCLDHVRAFNAGYNFFDGMTPEQIHEAQSPLAGWVRDQAGRKGREAFTIGDPLGVFGDQMPRRPAEVRWARQGDAAALATLGLGDSASGDDVRRAYKRLVRRYHPDSNGGDRGMEGKLQAVVNAYTQLKSSPRFKSETKSSG